MSMQSAGVRRGPVARAGSEAPGVGGQRWRRAGRWAILGMGGLLAFLVAAAGAGALYQALAGAADARAYPPPGRLVDVGGYRLHIACFGERRPGTPTVVLEDGSAGVGSIDWRPVQALVAPATRVCAYDRAGFGWSDPGPAPRTAGRVTAELHTLLRGAGEEGPYVLAGHSLGGYFNRVYASAHPGEVAGMVLVDASHEDQWGDPATQAGVAASRQLSRCATAFSRRSACGGSPGRPGSRPTPCWPRSAEAAGGRGEFLPHALLPARPWPRSPPRRSRRAPPRYGPTVGRPAAYRWSCSRPGTGARTRRSARAGSPSSAISPGSRRTDSHEVLAEAQHVSMLLTHAAPVAAAIQDVVRRAGPGAAA